jgi:hypothetical protein
MFDPEFLPDRHVSAAVEVRLKSASQADPSQAASKFQVMMWVSTELWYD